MLEPKITRTYRLVARLSPKLVQPVELALEAGIPEAILQDWVINYGDAMVTQAAALIDAWKLLNPRGQAPKVAPGK